MCRLPQPCRALLLAALSLPLLALMAPAPAAAELQVGDRVQLDLKLMNGRTATSDQLTDKLTVVEFWATWCGPCVKMLPHLKQMHKELGPRGMVLISVSNDDQASTAASFIQRNGMVWPQAHNDSQPTNLSRAWGVRGIPHAFLLSPDGELLWRGHPARIDAPLDDAMERFADRLTPNQLSTRESARQMRLAAKAMERDANEALPKVLELTRLVPVTHYENRTVLRAAERLRDQLSQADPDGARATALLAERGDEELEVRRYQALMHLGDLPEDDAAEADPDHGDDAADGDDQAT